uniref:Uncharacterized protein n=1 Tax=Anguilla anguilla TaxID=7936 RepID=A0A0E9QG70_ANGAN
MQTDSIVCLDSRDLERKQRGRSV